MDPKTPVKPDLRGRHKLRISPCTGREQSSAWSIRSLGFRSKGTLLHEPWFQEPWGTLNPKPYCMNLGFRNHREPPKNKASSSRRGWPRRGLLGCVATCPGFFGLGFFVTNFVLAASFGFEPSYAGPGSTELVSVWRFGGGGGGGGGLQVPGHKSAPFDCLGRALHNALVKPFKRQNPGPLKSETPEHRRLSMLAKRIVIRGT